MKYYWICIFDYKSDEELKDYTDIDVWEARRGTLLDEYYLCGEDMTREDVKKAVKEKSGVERFAKPRKGSGTYALVMDSNAFFYERFMIDVDTFCFNCHKKITGTVTQAALESLAYNGGARAFAEKLKNKIIQRYGRASLTDQYVAMQVDEWIDELLKEMGCNDDTCWKMSL